MLKLSNTSKLGCKSWSLEAYTTCPGAQQDGKAVPACATCYARGGFYNMPSVKSVREHNKEDWKRDGWISDMVYALRNETHFRWFDSGDMYSKELANKILTVMFLTPHVSHWLPTRMHKFEKFRKVIQHMDQLANVVVRLSSDSVLGEKVPDAFVSTTSTIIQHADEPVSDDTHVCPAYSQGGKCLSCRACWDKSVPVIAYPYHGRKTIKIKEVF